MAIPSRAELEAEHATKVNVEVEKIEIEVERVLRARHLPAVVMLGHDYMTDSINQVIARLRSAGMDYTVLSEYDQREGHHLTIS